MAFERAMTPSSIAAGLLAPGEEHEAERGRDGQGYEHRCQDRHQIAERERLEEGARAALHHDDRHDREQRDEPRVGQRSAHLERRVEHERRGRALAALLAVLAHTARDVVGAEDGVADDDGDRGGQSGEGDRVDRLAHEVQDERGRDERQRDRHERN
jgi:hypothetical protein